MDDGGDGDDTGQQLLEGVGNEVLFSVTALAASVIYLLVQLYWRTQGTAAVANTAAHVGGSTGETVHTGHNQEESSAQASSTSSTARGDVRNRSQPHESAAEARSRESEAAAAAAGSAGDDAAGNADGWEQSTNSANQPDRDATGPTLIDVTLKTMYSDSDREVVMKRRVPETTAIRELKSLLFGEEQEEMRRIRFVLQGRELSDSATLATCDYQRGTVLNVVIGVPNTEQRDQHARSQAGRPGGGETQEFDIAVLFPYILTAVCSAGWLLVFLQPSMALTPMFAGGLALLTAVAGFAWR
eukprot:scpid64460/ scgid20606/ 